MKSWLSRRRHLVVAASMALVGAGIAAPTASAGVYLYCGGSYGQNVRCGINSPRYYGYTDGSRPNPSGSNVWVCETNIDWSASSEFGQRCGWGTASYSWTPWATSIPRVWHTANASLVLNGTSFD